MKARIFHAEPLSILFSGEVGLLGELDMLRDSMSRPLRIVEVADRSFEGVLVTFDAMRAQDRQTPAFNHTRGDGPFNPCHICLEQMDRGALIDLVKDMQATLHEKDE